MKILLRIGMILFILVNPLKADEKAWIDTYFIQIGVGKNNYKIPSYLPLSRSYQDAWTSDGLFVPEYFRPLPYLPKYTHLTADTRSIQIGLEKSVLGFFFLGLVVGYREYIHTESSIRTVNLRNQFQESFYQDLSLLNQFRSRAFTAITLLPYTSEYWVGIEARFPFPELYSLRPYWDVGVGMGGCVSGESCNLTIYNGGLGIEWLGRNWAPYLELQKSRILQQRLRRTLLGEEDLLLVGIRYYP